MKLKKIMLKNFRNFKDNIFEFEKINIIIGLNGRGKSNLLEAIYFLGNAYSPRLVKTDDLIKWGEDFFYIKGDVEKKEGTLEVEISYKDKKIIKINGKKINKKIELINKIPMVIFFPSLSNFLFSSPSKRRYFLDREISKTSIYYYFNLMKYLALIKRRNIILKGKDKSLYSYLDTIDEELVKVGFYIIKERLDFIEKINKSLTIFSKLFDFGEVYIKYHTLIRNKDEFIKYLIRERLKDIEKGYTRIGPHRDDFVFLVKGHDAKSFASQGERKLITLFIVFSLWKMMKKEDLAPILLVDELCAELDSEKIEIVSGIIERSEGQIFITSLNDIPYIKEKRFIKL